MDIPALIRYGIFDVGVCPEVLESRLDGITGCGGLDLHDMHAIEDLP